MQSEFIDVELKAVKSDGAIWIIKGEALYIIDEDLFSRFKPGSETYRYKYNQLKDLKPLPESERIEILSKLLNNIKELM
jgi:hypothetical protein